MVITTPMESLKVTELRKILKRKGLSTTGCKAELVRRLSDNASDIEETGKPINKKQKVDPRYAYWREGRGEWGGKEAVGATTKQEVII